VLLKKCSVRGGLIRLSREKLIHRTVKCRALLEPSHMQRKQASLTLSGNGINGTESLILVGDKTLAEKSLTRVSNLAPSRALLQTAPLTHFNN